MTTEVRPQTMVHSICNYEIPANDADKLIRFYSGVFGWQFQGAPGMEDYRMAMTGEGQESIAIFRRENDGAKPANYIQVESVTEFATKVERAGGTVIHRFTVPFFGRGAMALDPEGNMIGLWQNDPTAQPEQ